MTNEPGYDEVISMVQNSKGELRPWVDEVRSRESVTLNQIITANVGAQAIANASGYKVLPYFIRIENNEPVNAIRFEIVDGNPAVAGAVDRWYVTVGAGLRWEGFIFPGVCTNVNGVFIDVNITLTVAALISLAYYQIKDREM